MGSRPSQAKGELVRSIMFPKPTQYVSCRDGCACSLETYPPRTLFMLFLSFNPFQSIAVLTNFHSTYVRSSFRFYTDSFKFIGMLAFVGLWGFVYSVIVLLNNGEPNDVVIVRAFDLVTTVSSSSRMPQISSAACFIKYII